MPDSEPKITENKSSPAGYSAKKAWSISARFTMCLMGLVLVATLAVMLTMDHIITSRSRERMENLAEEYSSFLVKSVRSPLWHFETETVKEMGKAFSLNPSVSGLTITDSSGRVVFDHQQPGNTAFSQVNSPIIYNGREIGALSLVISGEQHRKVRREAWRLVLIIMGMMAFALALAGGLVLRFFLRRPLNELGHLAEAYGKADYRPPALTATPPREFAPLLNVLNEMAQRITNQVGELRRAEEKYRSFFEHAPYGTWQIRQGGEIISVNQRMAEMFGYASPADLLGSISHSVSLHNDPDRRAVIIAALERHTQVLDSEAQMRRKDGSLFWAAISARALYDDEGEILMYQGSIVDITERKKFAEALKESEAKYRNMVESISDLIYSHDLNGHIVSANRAATEILGYSNDEILDMRIQDFIPQERREAYQEDFLPAILRDGSNQGIMPLLDNKGAEHFIEFSSSLIKRPGSDPIISGTGRDVTERILASRELRTMREQLTHSQKMEAVGTLASGVAHDFNNVLQAITGYVQLLTLDFKGDPAINTLDKIREAVERAAELTRRLLTFSRRDRLELKRLDLSEEVRHSIKMLERTIPKMVTIKASLAGNLPKVDADPIQVEQVVMNLGINAKDAMPEGGTLRISTEFSFLDNNYCEHHPEAVPGPYVLLRVQDTGAGMDKEVKNRIFEPFFTTKGPGRGTGLGLSTVYGIVKNSGGHISCKSETGKGTVFNIYFPQSLGRDSQAQPGSYTKGNTLFGSERVLMVDDEASIVEVGGNYLRQFGYKVETAGSGEEALEIYRDHGHELDLVLMDLGMPGMGGRKCMAEILALNPEAKIIIASGYSIYDQAKGIMRDGASGYIPKPYRFKDLLVKIRDILSS